MRQVKDMGKLLIICGPTATGKTTVAVKLAKKIGGEIISADSRQVYKGMDIGTGKDLQKDFKFKLSNLKLGNNKIGYYTNGKVKIWGYDLVSPSEEFSVAQFVKFAKVVINNIYKAKNLPILVGGTGLYIKGVVDGIPTAVIPKNLSLRMSLEKKSVKELFELLSKQDPVKSASLNSSDKKNPVRLVRAIEISEWLRKGGIISKQKDQRKKEEVLFIGLSTNRKKLNSLIKKRVYKRLKKGFEKEVNSLLSSGVLWKHQSMQSLGYKQWKDVVDDHSESSDVIEDWVLEECKYAKRQMTWFKKEKRLEWFDISKFGYRKNVEKLVNSWYSSK